MQEITLISKGRVQDVNYRYEVTKIAKKLKITGYVQNLEDKTVKIFAQGEIKNINQFIKEIQIKQEYGPSVNSIEILSKTECKNPLNQFTIKRF